MEGLGGYEFWVQVAELASISIVVFVLCCNVLSAQVSSCTTTCRVMLSSFSVEIKMGVWNAGGREYY